MHTKKRVKTTKLNAFDKNNSSVILFLSFLTNTLIGQVSRKKAVVLLLLLHPQTIITTIFISFCQRNWTLSWNTTLELYLPLLFQVLYIKNDDYQSDDCKADAQFWDTKSNGKQIRRLNCTKRIWKAVSRGSSSRVTKWERKELDYTVYFVALETKILDNPFCWTQVYFVQNSCYEKNNKLLSLSPISLMTFLNIYEFWGN